MKRGYTIRQLEQLRTRRALESILRKHPELTHGKRDGPDMSDREDILLGESGRKIYDESRVKL